MKLLITGGSGFLGKRTAAYFEELGHRVLTPTHSQLDITQPENVRNWFRENCPDAVIHTAAVSDTGLCQQKPEWSETINVAGCVNLAESCAAFGGKLVICSSDQVYFGSAVPGPHREEETLEPANVYGCQKLRAEQLCLEADPNTVCLRLTWMYDRESNPGEHGHFLATFRETLADETRPISWPVHDRRGITDVRYVVENLPKALALPGGVYNFGCENTASTHDTVKAVLEDLGWEKALARLVPNEQAFRDNPRDISIDTGKIRAAGIHFPTTRQGLVQALEGVIANQCAHWCGNLSDNEKQYKGENIL